MRFVYVLDRKGGGESDGRDHECCVLIQELYYLLLCLCLIRIIHHHTSLSCPCERSSMIYLCTMRSAFYTAYKHGRPLLDRVSDLLSSSGVIEE